MWRLSIVSVDPEISPTCRFPTKNDMGVLSEQISSALIRMGQTIPPPLRVALTQSPAAASHYQLRMGLTP